MDVIYMWWWRGRRFGGFCPWSDLPSPGWWKGKGWCWRLFAELPPSYIAELNLTKEEEIKVLEEEAKILERELERIKRRLKELKGD